MKILPIVKGMQNDITSSAVRLRRATKDGYNIADRTSKVYNQGKFKRYFGVTKCVTNKVVTRATIHELPYICAAIGLVTPIPFMSVLLFFVGVLARIPFEGVQTKYDKIKKSDSLDIKRK